LISKIHHSILVSHIIKVVMWNGMSAVWQFMVQSILL